MGAVLTQIIDGREKPICYASKSFSGPEKNYEVTRKELLAVVWAVRHFRHYWYLPFDVFTDHRALSYMDRLKTENSQVARWAFTLSAYPCKIHYRPGKDMQHADGLSRLPLPASAAEEDHAYDHPAVCRRLPALPALQELPGTRQWVAALRDGDPVPAALQRYDQAPTPTRQGWYLRDSLVWVGSRVCLPPEDARVVLAWMHKHPAVGGHMGADRLLHTYREGFLTVGEAPLARQTVQQCLTCQAQKDYGRGPQVPLHPLQPKHPFHIISLDFVGPYPRTQRQNLYMLTVVDLFSRFLIAIPTTNTTAQTVANLLIQKVFTVFNMPQVILTDQGPQFESTLVKELLQQFGVLKSRTTPYHPQTNGMNERVHRTLHNYLRCCIENERQWDTLLPLATMTYNNTRHVATGKTPHSLLFTWPRVPATLLHPVRSPTAVSLQEHKRAFLKAKTAILQHQEEANDRARTANEQARRYKAGDYIWLKNTPPVGDNPKFRIKWLGPFEVVQHDVFDVVTIVRKGAPYKVNAVRTKLCHFPPPR